MDDSASIEQVVELEQHFIDSLNVDLVASSSGYHSSMSQEMWEQLRKQRGTPVFVYDANDFTLLHIFPAKQYMFKTINIRHKTLDDCIDNGQVYLDTFLIILRSNRRKVESRIIRLKQEEYKWEIYYQIWIVIRRSLMNWIQ